ncbi:hypothetical protein [Streptomyces sp. NPDC017949]|uniref:hypothetical protein n=1 Tax=Streptomyces sp. NPDC017949 TaxID=3365020 RepID=UPI0037993CA0
MSLDRLFNDPVSYRTTGGAIVTVDHWNAECKGCGADSWFGDLRKWAAKHAEKCRALPRR